MPIGEKEWEKKEKVYVGFMNLEKTYDVVNKETAPVTENIC